MSWVARLTAKEAMRSSALRAARRGFSLVSLLLIRRFTRLRILRILKADRGAGAAVQGARQIGQLAGLQRLAHEAMHALCKMCVHGREISDPGVNASRHMQQLGPESHSATEAAAGTCTPCCLWFQQTDSPIRPCFLHRTPDLVLLIHLLVIGCD
jgi:hypothetical protein